MSQPVIQVENLSKAYQIGQIGTGTLSRDLERFWVTRVRGKEDPFLQIGETNDRSKKGESDIVWSLRDINFEVRQGEAVGIIGKNGAGKSTLLKLLSRVTGPTTGEIRVKGRIASLLEVGTGFHPELSGRENIFLNGAILGMRKKEIARKLDEIIDFSGVERYIDTPVKRYSSGMYVRLAFAVAAHLESEILIVDEVLAVGDAEFQKKCLGKMGDISKGQGRTVLFVSHNMAAVQNLCTRGLVIKNGNLDYSGSVSEAVQQYLMESHTALGTFNPVGRKGDGLVRIASVEAHGPVSGSLPQTGSQFALRFKLVNPQQFTLGQMRLDLRLDDALGQRVAWFSTSIVNVNRSKEVTEILFKINRLNLNTGIYHLSAHLTVNDQVSDYIQNMLAFEVAEGDFYGTGKIVPHDRSRVVFDFEIDVP